MLDRLRRVGLCLPLVATTGCFSPDPEGGSADTADTADTAGTADGADDDGQSSSPVTSNGDDATSTVTATTNDPSATESSVTATSAASEDTTASAGSEAADDTSTEDSSSGGASCDEEPLPIGAITVTSDMGECCGGTFAAMVDGTGLSGAAIDPLDGTHDCTDAGGWKSNAALTGYVQFDFEATHLVSSIYVWNSGQVTGQRGVDGVLVQTSLDGVAFEDLAEAPMNFARADVCPVVVEAFDLPTPTIALSVRIHVLSTYNEGGVSNTGLGEVMFLGTPCR